MRSRLTGTSIVAVALVVLTSCSNSGANSSSDSTSGPALGSASAPHSVCVDQLGDAAGLDLASAEVAIDNNQFLFLFTGAQPLPIPGYAAFDLVLADSSSQPIYNLSFVFDGSTRTFTGFDFATNSKFPVPDTTKVSGNSVSGSIDLTLLPNLPSASTGFTWSANAGGKTGSDRCPEFGNSPLHPTMQSFPQ